MAIIQFQYDRDSRSEVYKYPENPSCNHKNKGPCDPCGKLVRIEAQIQELQFRLRDLCAEHRSIRQERNSIHCFISNLPYDITSYIFILCLPPVQLACTPEEENPFILKTPILPLQIAAVCGSWRSLALSIPGLWTRISIRVDKPDFTSLNHRLQWSGSAPLLIRLRSIWHDNYQCNVRDTMVLVKQHLHRIEYLCIDLPSGYFKIFRKGFNLDRTDAAPLLQELHIHNISATKNSDFGFSISTHPPSPRRVSMLGTVANKAHINWDHLSHLMLYATNFNNLSILLSKVNCLVNLYVGLRNIDDGIKDESMHALPIINHSSIRDMTLRYSQKYSRFLIFSHANMSSLENLSIHPLYSPDFPSFSRCFLAFLRRSACHLKSLDMDLRSPSKATMEMLGDVLQETVTVQEFSLYVKEPGTLDLEPFFKRLINDQLNADSNQKALLPFLRKFSFKGISTTRLDLLLDIIMSRSAFSSSQTFQFVQPMENLTVHYYDKKVDVISEGDLTRILQLQAAGKSVIVNALYWNTFTEKMSICDMVKLAMENGATEDGK